MVKYRYDKYTAVASTLYQDTAPWEPNFGGAANYVSVLGAYKSYIHYSQSNQYNVLGEPYISGQYVPIGTTVYAVGSDGRLNRWVTQASGYAEQSVYGTSDSKIPSKNSTTTTYTRGTLVQSNIEAEDGTYPANGRHTDGYWYVKGEAVGPLPPGTVINQPYSTAGNGGRKLVRLSNGTLVSAVWSGTTSTRPSFQILKSINNGTTWEMIRSITLGANGVTDVALATDGAKIFILYTQPVTASNFHATMDVILEDKTVLVNNKGIDSGQTAIGNVSLAIDPTNGHLHAAWSSKNSKWNNSFNIRYAKSTDGGATWSTVEEVTNFNVVGANNTTPTIAVRKDGKPIIIYYEAASSTSHALACKFFDGSTWAYKYVNKGTYTQDKPSAVVDKNGVIHVAWQGTDASSTTPKIRYSKSADGGVTWSTQNPIINGFNPSITVDKNGNRIIIYDTGASIGRLTAQSNETWVNTFIISDTNTNVAPSALSGETFDIVFGDTPPLIYSVTGKSVQYIGTYSTNSAPTVALVSPSNNQTLYENDTFNINGTTLDTDNGNTVTIRYQINALTTRAIKAFLSDGTTLESFSKSLTFIGGNLYDGTTLIAENLSDGVAHTLKVWATDDQGGTSVVKEIPFYVVPNRAPLLTVNSPVINGLIDSDKFTIDGTFEDSDGNTTIVSYRINGSTSVQIAEGVSGPFTFDVSFGQLNVGLNQIVVEAIDSYGAKVSKTIKLNKNEVKSEQLCSTARNKINPPTGSAKAVLLWIQRDENLDIDVSVSMTMQGEAESFIPLTVSSSAPLEYGSSTIEDEFYYEANGSKDNIILQIDMERASLEVDDKIYLISGVLD